MKEYLSICDNVLDGKIKKNRTGRPALTTFCETFRHNMSEGFPLLTTKKMPIKTIAVELEGFIKGVTDKKWFQDRGCRIWNEWANPERDTDPYEERDLGPIYGFQWRSFNARYSFNYKNSHSDKFSSGIDQLKNVVEILRSNPDDRRMVVSAWNPQQTHQMALPPCHYAFTLVHIDGVLNLSWKQRSADLALGVPFNIASYALLLLLLCKSSDLKPGQLFGLLEDCHVYDNHVDKLEKQLNRSTYALPKLHIKAKDIFEWDHTDIDLIDYKCHPKIDFGPVAV